MRRAAATALILLAGLLGASVGGAWQAPGSGGGAEQARQAEEAQRMILCDCGCHPQSVKECACGRAAEMRGEINDLVVQGMTGEQVVAHYVSLHGEKIRIAPTAEGFNLVAWLGPFAGISVAMLLVLWTLRRWRAAHAAPAPAIGPAAAPGDEAYLRRLRDQLKELE